MEALALALLPLALDAINGESLAAIVAGLTAQQWVTLGFDLVNATDPNLATQVKAKLSGLSIPALGTFISDLEQGKDVEAAAAVLRDALSNLDKPPPTIPGYARDGSVRQIPNPDLKQGE